MKSWPGSVKGWLDGILSNLVWGKLSLAMEEGLEPDDLSDSFWPKPPCDFMEWWKLWSLNFFFFFLRGDMFSAWAHATATEENVSSRSSEPWK